MVKQQHPLHIIDIIVGYFITSNINAQNFKLADWDIITRDLFNSINITDTLIDSIKNKYKEDVFKQSYQEYITLEEYDKHQIYLNPTYNKVIVNCNRIEFKMFYPRILNAMWINNIINYENDKFGVILFNIIENYTYLSNVLISLSKHSLLRAYINYTYSAYSSNKYKIIYDNRTLNSKVASILIRNYASYVMFKLKERFGDYFVYCDTDIFCLAGVNNPKFELSSINDYISDYFSKNFSISYTTNIDYMFLNIKKYLYIKNGEISFVGIGRLDVNDQQEFLKYIRTKKLNDILE